MKYFRLNEYKAMIYRISLVYLMYSFSRFLFFVYNYSLLEIDSLFEYFKLSYHGLAFDTTSIFYLNSLFVVLSILPFWVNTNKTYQTFLFGIYFLTNLVGIAFNFVDLIYYKFNYNR
ncbi:MAG: LTA synthase family protein, partial [Flavobacteriaceae bacterium]|nr:LTA synthase family protein [Flavobacteriaceae bacterium]